MSCCFKVIAPTVTAGNDVFLQSGQVVGSDLVLTLNDNSTVTVAGIGGQVDFSALTNQQITDLCNTITANCDLATGLQINGTNLELVDGNGDVISSVSIPASAVTYNNGASGLTATTVQAALDEIASDLGNVSIDAINLQPTANTNEYTVDITWTNSDGVQATVADATPITIVSNGYQADFAAGDWSGGNPNTLTVPAGTHGLGPGMKVVTVRHNGFSQIVGLGYDVDPVTGDVTLEIGGGAGFDGTIYITA